MKFSRPPKKQAESIAIPMTHLVEGLIDDQPGSILNPEVAHWLMERGVQDSTSSCEWWVDKVNTPHCIRVWISDPELRMLFKLTWGGV